jgi:hypothetical protein
MAHGKKDLMLSDKETLIKVIEELQLKLKKKNLELNRARTKLSLAKTRVMKMKDTVEFQRKRIIELYS